MSRNVLAIIAILSAGVSFGEPGMEFENAGRNCIALTVFTEARGEPIDGQIAVAEVIRNRIADDRWGADPCEVVAQLHQFHGFRDWPRPSYPWDIDRDAWDRALAVTDGVMIEGWSSACGTATHFWRGPTPQWAQGAVTCEIGNHLFAVLP